MAATPPNALNATVHARTDLTDELAIVQVSPEGFEPPPFEPGQYATLGLPADVPGGLQKRVYSIASAPGQRWLEFYIQLVKPGDFTRRLWTLHEGDRLHLSEKVEGGFTLQRAPAGADLVLLSTGTGLAPYMSMVRAYAGKERWRRAAVVHGARRASDLGYRDELLALVQRDPSLSYVPVVSRDPDWDGLAGRVQQLLQPGEFERRAGFPLDPQRCHVFLCGNPAMIDDMDAALTALGFTAPKGDAPGNLHFERWW
jgi:ferredoxin--NADP+ reductase